MKDQDTPLINTFDRHLKQVFGQKVQKIPLDAGSGCPNRDGTVSTGGCCFCNGAGSGTGLGTRLSLREQWTYWREKFAFSDRLKHTKLFLAYLQSFTNTYGPASRLEKLIGELADLPDMAGIAIGTRPDCADREKLSIIASAPGKEKWIEFGVQSMNDRTLERIGRGHDSACTVKAVSEAHEAGLLVCIHLMAGLPGETPADFLDTVRAVCKLPIDGIKLHGLYVCEGARIAEDWRRGLYEPMDMETYIGTAADAISIIPPHIILHRITADPAAGELLAPQWASQKGTVVRGIEDLLRLTGRRQGSALQG